MHDITQQDDPKHGSDDEKVDHETSTSGYCIRTAKRPFARACQFDGHDLRHVYQHPPVPLLARQSLPGTDAEINRDVLHLGRHPDERQVRRVRPHRLPSSQPLTDNDNSISLDIPGVAAPFVTRAGALVPDRWYFLGIVVHSRHNESIYIGVRQPVCNSPVTQL